MQPHGVNHLSQLEPSASYLIWEEPPSPQWWLCRCRYNGVMHIIVRDPLLDYLLLLREVDSSQEPKLITALPLTKTDSVDALTSKLKEHVHTLNNYTDESLVQSGIIRWRIRRTSFLCIQELPLILAALLAGSFLAFIISFFIIITNLQGWLMILVGSSLGIVIGMALRWVANKKMGSLNSSWGRFFSTIFSATIAAFLTAALCFTLFVGY